MLRHLLFLIIVTPGALLSQSSTYSGKVFVYEKDKEEALIGALVRVPGSLDPVSTDIDGDFIISILDSIPPIVLVNYGCSIDVEPAFLLRRNRENSLDIFQKSKRSNIRVKRRLRKIWQNAGLDPNLF